MRFPRLQPQKRSRFYRVLPAWGYLFCIFLILAPVRITRIADVLPAQSSYFSLSVSFDMNSHTPKTPLSSRVGSTDFSNAVNSLENKGKNITITHLVHPAYISESLSFLSPKSQSGDKKSSAKSLEITSWTQSAHVSQTAIILPAKINVKTSEKDSEKKNERLINSQTTQKIFSIKSEKNKEKIILQNVPVISQNHKDPWDEKGGTGLYPDGYCGPASMQMILGYYDIHKSRDYLALTDLGSGKVYKRGVGSRYNAMIQMFRHLGLKNTDMIWNKSIGILKKNLQQGRPQIVSLKGDMTFEDGSSRYTNGHIVVVTGIDTNQIIIHDPAPGIIRKMSHKNFLKSWRGFILDPKG